MEKVVRIKKDSRTINRRVKALARWEVQLEIMLKKRETLQKEEIETFDTHVNYVKGQIKILRSRI